MNKPKGKILLSIVVTVQLLVVFGLLVQIKYKKSKVLGKSVNVINKDSIERVKSSNYKYFYEPRGNYYEIVHLPWSPNDLPVYTTNADTLNERFDYQVTKPENTFRIITIGDSFTFGQNVSTQDNWTELLEDELNKNNVINGIKKYEVINLGVYGYDTAYEVERYRLRGQKYKPDLVIWFITDLNRITEEYLEISNNLNDSNKEKLNEDHSYSLWENIRRLLLKKYGEKRIFDYQIGKIKELREKYYGGPILFISLDDKLLEIPGQDMFFVDTNVHKNKENILPDGHFNELGHKAFMKEVLKQLHDDGLVPFID